MTFLGDLCFKIGSGATPKGGKDSYRGGGYALIRSQNVQDWEFTKSGLAYINDEQASKLDAVQVESGDVLLNITGDSVTRACIVPADIRKARVNQHVCIVRPDGERLDNVYLLMFLESIKRRLLQIASSGATRNALTKASIEALDLRLPTIEEQRRIAAPIRNISAQIDNLTQINGHLLELTSAKYVELSKNQKNCNLNDICEFVNDKTAIENAVLETYVSTESLIADKRGRQIASKLPTSGKVTVYHPGDILISNIRPYFKKIWFADCMGTCSNDVLAFRAKSDDMASLLYFTLYSDAFFEYTVAGSKGTKMPRGDKKQIMSYRIPAIDDVVKVFSSEASKVLNLISTNRREIATLEQLRDALLPKLMSGEIDASKVELPTPPEQAQTSTNGRLWLVRVLFSCCSALCIWTSRTSVEAKGSTMVGNHTVESILKAMQNTLNAHQLKRLKGVLSANLAVETNTVEDNENKNLLNSFLTAKELEGCSERTLKYYESTLAHYIRETSAPLTQVDTEQLRAYLTDYQDTHVVGKVTIDNIRRILATFFSWLEDEGYIVKSPARKIRRVKAPVRVKEIISDEDMERLRDGCETIRDLAMIDLLSSTGMRVGELVKLNRTSINMGERECIVQGKGNKERKAYFDARAKLHLEEYLRERNDDNPALFVGLCGNHARISICSVENRLRSLGKKLQLPRVHPHKFRRTMATNAINRGMPVEQVQKLLGHVKIETTMEYALVSQSNVKASHRRYLG